MAMGRKLRMCSKKYRNWPKKSTKVYYASDYEMIMVNYKLFFADSNFICT